MPSQNTEFRKLAAIMFTDMVGYSDLSQRNEPLALELVAEQRRLMRTLLPLHGGREVKSTGDGFLLEFKSALSAARCAVEVQETLRRRNAASAREKALLIRIGIHMGDVVEREGDLFGDGVNIAARIEPLAEPGGVCVSEDVARQIQNKIGLPLLRSGTVDLKHVQLPVVVFKLVLGAPPPNLTQRTKPRRQRTGRQLVAVLGATAVAVLLAVFLRKEKPAAGAGSRPAGDGRITALAVRPFDDFSGDTTQAYLSDGMTEALCTALGNISALRVPGRSSVMRYKNTKKSISELARELRVDAVVEGSVQRAGNRILITVQLVEAASDRHLWATNYERDLGEFFKVQNEVARAVANEVRVRVTPEDQARLARASSAQSGVVEAYLHGMHEWWQWSDTGASNALRHFSRAIELDPRYAPAHAGVALAYMMGSGSLWSPRDVMPRCRQAALRAIALDPSLPEGYDALGWARFYFDWDWGAAETNFVRAVDLSPRSPLALDALNNFLVARGRFPEAVTVLNRALEVDPLSPALHSDLGWTHWLAGDPAKGIPHLRRALELDRNFLQARTWLGWTYLFTGKTNEALLEFQSLLPLDPDSPWPIARLGCAYGFAGRRADALAQLAALEAQARRRPIAPGARALVYVGLGQHDAALDWLEKACDERASWMVWLKVDPLLVPLRKEPRFQALMKRVELD